MALLLAAGADARAQSPFSPIETESTTRPIQVRPDPPADGSTGAEEDDEPEDEPVWGAGTIEDPDNPQQWGAGAIEDPDNPRPWGAGTIEDPDNPQPWGAGTIEDPDNPQPWGAGTIEDPDNPSGSSAPPNPRGPSVATTQTPTPGYAGTPRAIFSGEFASDVAVDTRRDDAVEDTLELSQQLEMRVRYEITSRWRAIIEGRLDWTMTGAGDPDAPPWLPESDRVQGRVTPELRDFYVAGRAGRWLMRFGNQSIVWGSTDVTRPADQINPVDLRRGFTAAREDLRVPVPAVDLVHAWNRVSWQFVLVPFFVPHRVSVYGSDSSPIRPSGLTLPALPGIEGLTLVDPSLEDLAQPLLLQTALPEETLRNVSAGSRLTLIRGGWDVSLGYFYGWDRVPRVALSAPAEALLVLATTRPDELFDAPLEELPEVQAVLADIADGVPPLTATYDRMHMLEFDGVKYLGPIGLRWELAYSPRRTNYTADLRSVRRPSLSSALELSYESSDGEVVVAAEGFHLYSAARASDGDYLYGLDSLFGLAGGLTVGFGSFERAAGRFAEDLSLRLAGIYLPRGRDLVLAPALAWDANDRLELSVGATVFHSFGAARTFGDLLDRNDAVFVRVSRVF